MSATTDAAVTLSPSGHYQAAGALLDKAAGMGPCSASQMLIARAQAHATLALYVEPYDTDYEGDDYLGARRIETREPTGNHL